MTERAEQQARRRANQVAWHCTDAMATGQAVRVKTRSGDVLEGIPERAYSVAPDWHLIVTLQGREVDVFDLALAEEP